MQGRASMKGTPQSASSAGGRRSGAPAAVHMSGGSASGAGPLRPPLSPPARPPSALGAYARGADEPPRTLPDGHITAATVEDAYVQFVFYCNPYLSANADATELRRGFNSMPKTDGRTFEPFVLFELIRRLEAREIETWAQLVMEMGVKAPDVQSGQSAQKVQQYAVRLKRWLHAYHIDAFFQFCLGKNNTYFTEIPMELNEHTIRDGVPPEEDLALRALVPKLRPKRGRRPNDDTDGSPNAKRVLRATSLTADEQLNSAMPMSAYPQSAFPWDRHSNSTDAWLRGGGTPQRTTGPRSDATQRAPGSTQRNETIHQPLPSIEGPSLSFSFDADADGDADERHAMPQSAIASRGPLSAFPRPTPPPASAHPSTSAAHRSRKRHGPAVSAAWTRDESGGRTRARGRPPAQPRTTQNGLFGTFRAKESGTGTGSSGSANANAGPPGSGTPPTPQQQQQQPHGQTPTSASTPASAGARSKPSKLQLQVPQHEGGPVRLATPPAPRPQGGLDASGASGGAGGSGVGTAAGGSHHHAGAPPAYQQHPYMRRPSLTRARRGSHLRNASRSSAEFFTRDHRDESELPPEDDVSFLIDDALDEHEPVDWKRRALGLARKVKELEGELRAVRRRVMEAVM